MSYGLQLDTSMGIMEETRFKKKHATLIKRLSKELHFTYNELEAIMLIYYKLYKNRVGKRDGISKDQFSDFLHSGLDMTDTDLTNTMLMTYFKGGNPIVSLEKWARIMSMMLRGTIEEKIKHCYSIYDTLNTGKIGRDTMFGFLENSLVEPEEDAEDAVKDMIEVLAKKMDVDRDGKICFEDFRQSCLMEPLLLESLGQCLPSRLAAYTFLTSFTHHLGKM